MIEPFKKLAFHDEDSATMMQILQDNIEAWTKQFENYPASVLGLDKIRIPRPRFYVDVTGTKITIPGSEGSPVKLLINGGLYQSEETIYCELSKTGVGGLLTGSIAANTPYYLYGHLSKGIPYISASTNDPDTGPEGYDHWTYIGACATRETSAVIRPFSSSSGEYLSGGQMENFTHTGSTSTTQMVFSGMPKTVSSAKLRVTADDGDAGDITYVGPTSGVFYSIIVVESGTFEVNQVGWVPIITEQSVWIDLEDSSTSANVELVGWQEDPTEWK